MSTKKHDVPDELLSGLLANYKKPEDLIGENGLLKQLTKLFVEKALDAELTEHLGHERNEAVSNPGGNTRNGKSKKTLKGDFGELPIQVPQGRRFPVQRPLHGVTTPYGYLHFSRALPKQQSTLATPNPPRRLAAQLLHRDHKLGQARWPRQKIGLVGHQKQPG